MKNRPIDAIKEDSANFSWEADIVANQRKSTRTAWIVAGLAMGLSCVLAVAIVIMIPLRKVVPYTVMVDKLTGETSVISTAKDFVSTSPLSDKHWIKSFLISRERYVYRLVQHDYNNVKRMAGNSPWSSYNALFSGEDSLEKKYAENVEIIPVILSISLDGDGIARVRYELRTKDFRKAADTTTRRVATLRYSYEAKKNILESEAVENPFGFTVTGYQTDPEFATPNQTGGAL